MKEFYVTTAIDYVNAEPHIGHAYQKIIADVLARWHRLNGDKVFFSTGTDEHGQKIARTAESQGKKAREFVNENSAKFKEAWKSLNIKYDRFIRTTDSEHKQFVYRFLEKVKKDIYKGEYQGLYCVGCEAYVTEKDLVNGECPYHIGKKLDALKEETYFFKLSKYQKSLLEFYKKNPDFILPRKRTQEIVNRVKQGLNDLSITRTNFDWGIPYPYDKKHVLYVWFEALLNYLTVVDPKKEFWPPNVQLLGVDNSWFHCVIWPAMLMSAGIELPKSIFIHGFLTFNNQKISKSLGNTISPIILAEKYTSDSLRYFVCRNFVLGEDGDFSEKLLIERHNNELANKLGNLVSRVTALAEKHGLKKTSSTPLPNWIKDNIAKGNVRLLGNIGESKLKENKLLGGSHIQLLIKTENGNYEGFGLKNPKQLREYLQSQIFNKLDNCELDKALNDVFLLIDYCNWYTQEKKPWETGNKRVLYELADSIKAITILLSPFIPEFAEKVSRHFGFKLSLKEIEKSLDIKSIKKSEVLFKKS